MSFCSVAAYSFMGIMTRPKEIAPFHMLRMPSPYPARSGTDTTVLSRISLSAMCSTLGHNKEASMSDMGLERPLDDAVEQDQDVIPDPVQRHRPAVRPEDHTSE